MECFAGVVDVRCGLDTGGKGCGANLSTIVMEVES